MMRKQKTSFAPKKPFLIKTSNLKVGLGRKEEGRKERIERKKTGKKQKEKRDTNSS